MNTKVHSEILDHSFTLNETPRRIVSLSSGFTEALFEMDLGDRVVGISEYCPRYCAQYPGFEKTEVVGQYLNVDFGRLEQLKPDLILITSGIQTRLGKVLAKAGYPVYALPLADSLYGIYANIITLASLCNQVEGGRALVRTMEGQLAELRRPEEPGVSTYAEPWFGVHPRRVGGRSFIHDILWYGGCDPIFGQEQWAYGDLDYRAVAEAEPQVFVGFHEPEHRVDFAAESHKRGWGQSFSPAIITSDVGRGRNIIHDGPSLVETARWLRGELRSVVSL